MKRIILTLLLLPCFLFTKAQEKKESKLPKFQVHGFIKSDYWYDSRQVVSAREGLFTLFPKDVDYDKLGNDINASGTFNYTAISSRINAKIEGPNSFGAKTFGFIEGGFTGASNANINTFRLRHAYIQMDWTKSTLLMGQFWHPMFVTEVFPSIVSLNTGAPFQPFLRSPQIRYTQHWKKLDMIVAALSQRDYTSIGPQGRSYTYLSNSLTPNVHFQLKYKSGNNTIGAAADYKTLKPRLQTDSNIVTSSTISSLSYMAYYKYKKKGFEVKTKVVWGENLADNLMLGGYAVASIDSLTDERTYTSTQHLFSWLNLSYLKQYKRFALQPGIFLGFAQNMGTKTDNVGIYYATGANIDKMYRVSPKLNFKSGKMMFSVEWEYTHVMYGQNENSGIVNNTHAVANNRILFTAFYFF